MPDNDLQPGDRRTMKASHRGRKGRKPPPPIRASRMQIEKLERRDMMAALGDPGVDSLGEDPNAAMMSAFFEQSALYYVRQPVSFPNVTWISHLEPSYLEPPREEPSQQIARIDALIEMELNERDWRHDHLALPPGVGGRTASGARRMLRLTTEWPTHVFAPTVDMGDSPIVDLSRLARTKGILFFDLAYIAADGDNRPSWCGMADRLVGAGDFDAALREQIDDLRAMGGDVIVSFGGPGARPLAEAITDVKQLKGAYRGVVDAYAVSRINFDLDGAALDDRAAVERRWQATAALVHELSNDGLPLEVWVTLPATKSGLSKAALDALRSAGKHGLYLDGVNLKTDAGAGPSPEAQPAAGSATIRAAINAYAQAAQVLARGADGDAAWTGIGITPAVGGNTSTGTPLTPNDARELVDFAQRHGLGMLGTWQTTRGLPEKHAQQGARPSGAGIEQAAAEIMEIFGEFTGSLRE